MASKVIKGKQETQYYPNMSKTLVIHKPINQTAGRVNDEYGKEPAAPAAPAAPSAPAAPAAPAEKKLINATSETLPVPVYSNYPNINEVGEISNITPLLVGALLLLVVLK